MNIDIRAATLDEKPVLAQLLELYQYDFTEYSDEDVGDDGRFGISMEYLDKFWTEDTRWPLLLRVDGKLAGFALVRRAEGLDGSECYDMVEFFVMRKYRRAHAGEALARHCFDTFRGRWQVREVHNNGRAHAFWRAIIGRYTGGAFSEQSYDDERWHGPVQTFDSSEQVAIGNL